MALFWLSDESHHPRRARAMHAIRDLIDVRGMSNDLDRREADASLHLLGVGPHCAAALIPQTAVALERDDGCEGNTHVTVRNSGVGATLIRGIFAICFIESR